MLALWLAIGVSIPIAIILTSGRMRKARGANSTHRLGNSVITQRENLARKNALKLIADMQKQRKTAARVAVAAKRRGGYVATAPLATPPTRRWSAAEHFHAPLGYCPTCQRRRCWNEIYLIQEDDIDGRLQEFLQELQGTNELRRQSPNGLHRTQSSGPP